MSENTLIEDEIDIKMDPDEIPNTKDTEQVPNKMDTEQDPIMDIEQVLSGMDTEQNPDRIEPDEGPEHPAPFDELIEEQVPNKMDTEQDPIMDIEQALSGMDTEQNPDRIEPEEGPEHPAPFDELIEELAIIKNMVNSKDSATNTDSPTIDQPITTTPTTHTNKLHFRPILPKPTVILVSDNAYDHNITNKKEIKKLENYKKQQNDKLEAKEKDAIERMRLIHNVLKRAREMAETPSEEVPVPPIQRLQFVTKANPDYLTNVLQGYKPRNRSVRQAALDTKPILSLKTGLMCDGHMNPDIFNDIREVFVEFYLKKKQIPTQKEFIESLLETDSTTSKAYYRNIKLRTLVKNNLVIYHHIPTLNRYILIENPEFAYRRNKYLRQITKYRESGAQLVYVAAMPVNTNDRSTSFLTLAASATAGLIGQLRPVSTTPEGFSSTIKRWLADLLPSLDPTAIVILTQPRKKDPRPTLYSTKDQIITWLKNQNIPTELDASKWQLFQLVKLSKNNKDTGFYDEVFTSADFKVIINPFEYKSLNYFNAIYREFASNYVGEFDEVEKMNEFMNMMPQEDWRALEVMLIEQEKQMIKEDGEMETMIENIFEMVKNGDVDENDFPEGCKGDRYDNFDVHIGDILVD